jgi:uncharacterized membrane protein YdbT with pleckstrin-like domain
VHAFWHSFGHHLDKSLLKNEKLVIQERRHWVVLLPVLLPAVGVVIVAFWLPLLASDTSQWEMPWFLWCVALAAVLYFAWKVLEWRNEIIYFTDMRIMIGKGIISRKNSFMLIDNVVDHTLHRPVLGRIFGYGAIRLESAGKKPNLETINYLPRPEELFPKISSLFH